MFIPGKLYQITALSSMGQDTFNIHKAFLDDGKILFSFEQLYLPLKTVCLCCSDPLPWRWEIAAGDFSRTGAGDHRYQLMLFGNETFGVRFEDQGDSFEVFE